MKGARGERYSFARLKLFSTLAGSQCKAYFGTPTRSAENTNMSKKDAKPETTSTVTSRPVGLSFSSFFYAAAGVYYLLFPLVSADPTVWPLYVIGGLSVLGSFGVLKMTRWGLWLGLLLFLPQVVAPAFALLAALAVPGIAQQPIAIAFVASLIILMFFASLTFLLILDKKRTFK